MLTAKDLLADKIEGFEAGADDYLVKPFSLAELDARLKALVRRDAPAGNAAHPQRRRSALRSRYARSPARRRALKLNPTTRRC